ncbi:MAG: SusD/RagB family nutrient-binding outer membrane lipoprotein [Gemmatimonadaceae bacterium]
MMIRRAIGALGIVATAGAIAGCNDYFSGPGIDSNPNTPVVATAAQLFVGFQGLNFYNLTGDEARLVSLFTQQFAGTGRQWAGYDHYELTENDFGWDGFYTGGGLVDLYKVQDLVKADKLYLGVTQVWEAMTVTMIADVWGDVPYTDAGRGNLQPKLDDQIAVYAKLQTLLDQAITNLNGPGAGPGSADLVYGGDKDLWIRAAHTLKARIYMHTAEVSNGDYAKALTETALGIANNSGDFTSYQSASTGEINHWFQFRIQRGTDMGAGKYLVDLMKSRDDPRLFDYFSPGSDAGGEIFGSEPNSEDDGTIAWLGAVRGKPDFRQPILTWDENILIKAEAQYKTGVAAAAIRATLNTYRAAIGMGDVDATLTGPTLFNQIMEEKYIAEFQNVEAWNDWKRTCYPNVTPADGSNYIPARILYPSSERNTNTAIPTPSAQPLRNKNDPKTATDPLGAVCKGSG